MSNFDIKWVDGNREPQCKPNPAYPNGIDIDCSYSRSPICKSDLPYPAKRCGIYVVECLECGQIMVITTAGRLDDPRSVTLSCEMRGMIQ